MPGNSDGSTILEKYRDGLSVDYTYRSDPSPSDFDVECGVIFLMAFWSGPAVITFRKLCSILASASLPPGFTFRVFDIDGCGSMLEQYQRHVTIGGSGEAFWMHRCQVIGATSCPTMEQSVVDGLLLQMGDA